MNMIKAVVFALMLLPTAVGATLVQVTVEGDGFFIDGTDLGFASASFSFDTGDVIDTQPEVFPSGTGTRWALVSSPISLMAGGVSYATPDFDEVTMFEATSNDQFSFSAGGRNVMQWNDSTGSAFVGPVTTDLDLAIDQFLEQLATNLSFELANGGANFRNLDSTSLLDEDLIIRNATVVVDKVLPVPEPNLATLLALGILGLGLTRRKRT